jgi:hypothetical protein
MIVALHSLAGLLSWHTDEGSRILLGTELSWLATSIQSEALRMSSQGITDAAGSEVRVRTSNARCVSPWYSRTTGKSSIYAWSGPDRSNQLAICFFDCACYDSDEFWPLKGSLVLVISSIALHSLLQLQEIVCFSCLWWRAFLTYWSQRNCMMACEWAFSAFICLCKSDGDRNWSLDLGACPVTATEKVSRPEIKCGWLSSYCCRMWNCECDCSKTDGTSSGPLVPAN